MELPAENKRTALLPLVVLGALLVIVLTVFAVFDGDDGDAGGGDAASVATTGAKNGAGTGAGGGSGASASEGAAKPIVEAAEVAEAHAVMAKYMTGLTTYDHTSKSAAWSGPLLALTTDDTRMKQATVLPSGKEWATCQAEKCSSKGTAVVERDAVIADDLVRGSGRTISSLVKVTATHTSGGQSSTEDNEWLVTVKEDDGQWEVSGFDVFGLGDVGSSEDAGE
ncbi:hypothetical protein ACWC9X_01525 [Streptomyces asoensis]|uniref:hypothetical protein n=1 Tax=Streptomyces TaxID=1883 RepID=UPI001909CE30|nr:hypothetical protein [Streptomyces sp. MBT49]MBK3626694.1 hypothetical protein [Streptomyces sp. MBT49]